MADWYYNLIKYNRLIRRIEMGLEQIISAIPEGTTQTLMPEHHDSLCRIEELLEYTEPRFKQISHTENSRFMIFSAPGATGKTTLYQCV